MLILTTIIVIVLPLILYAVIKRKFTYWNRKGLNYIEPKIPYGNSGSLVNRQIYIGDLFENFYKHFKVRGQKHGGVYLGTMPTYIPVDIDIVKNILQNNFSSFINRGIFNDEKLDPLRAHLFNLEGEKWKNLRNKLTPTFSSGKMKMMFFTMTACTEGLKDILQDHAKVQSPVDIKDVLGRFTTDIIGSVAFGIDCNSLKNPESDFRKYGKKIFELPKRNYKRLLEIFMSRKTLSKLGIRQKTTPQDLEDFFMDVVKSTVNYRETNNIYRKDILHLLLQLKNRGEVTDDENIFVDNENKTNGNFLTINQLAAQCFVFFAAGFETSATTMTFALLELALNEDIQETLREEIVTVLKKHNDVVSYDAVMEMHYLDKVINETLRKHPPVSLTPRKCNKDYKVPGTDFTIEAGTFIMIPIQGIHHDPDYYPEPDKFDPERFSEENKTKRPPMTFLSFGDGPRICIGARFGLLQAKVGLIAAIRDFKVTVNERTKLPIEYAPGSTITAVKGDVWLNVTKLD